jgi:hypothetical protein
MPISPKDHLIARTTPLWRLMEMSINEVISYKMWFVPDTTAACYDGSILYEAFH